jgi:capsular polysaccharide transport system permease protein
VSVSLVHSFAIQRRVIGALLMREIITRYGRHNIGVLWLVVEPMLFTLGVAVLWSMAKMHEITGVPTVAFAITGYSSVLVWRNATNRCARAIEPNLSLMYHRNVKVIDIFLSRVLLELIGASASFVALALIFAAAGFIKWPDDVSVLVNGWFLLCWFALALGFIVGSITERSESLERIWHVITYLLFPLSGAAFMLDWLPAAARKIVIWLPMVHGVEMIRHGFFGNVVRTYEDPLYFCLVNLVLTLFGLALVKECGRRVEPE